MLAALGVGFALVRKRVGQMFYVVGAGVLFGFVVTLAKVVIDRIKTLIFTPVEGGGVEWLLIFCIVALLARRAARHLLRADRLRRRARPTSWSPASP